MDADKHMLSFWVGVDGIYPGSSSSNEASEALHSAWQRDLLSIGGRAQVRAVLEKGERPVMGARVPSLNPQLPSLTIRGVHLNLNLPPRDEVSSILPIMAKLYEKWEDFYSWNADAPLGLDPDGTDLGLLHGDLLGKLGRSTALQLREQHAAGCCMHFTSAHADPMLVAVASSTKMGPLSSGDAASGVELLSAEDAKILQLAQTAGIVSEAGHSSFFFPPPPSASFWFLPSLSHSSLFPFRFASFCFLPSSSLLFHAFLRALFSTSWREWGVVFRRVPMETPKTTKTTQLLRQKWEGLMVQDTSRCELITSTLGTLCTAGCQAEEGCFAAATLLPCMGSVSMSSTWKACTCLTGCPRETF